MSARWGRLLFWVWFIWRFLPHIQSPFRVFPCHCDLWLAHQGWGDTFYFKIYLLNLYISVKQILNDVHCYKCSTNKTELNNCVISIIWYFLRIQIHGFPHFDVLCPIKIRSLSGKWLFLITLIIATVSFLSKCRRMLYKTLNMNVDPKNENILLVPLLFPQPATWLATISVLLKAINITTFNIPTNCSIFDFYYLLIKITQHFFRSHITATFDFRLDGLNSLIVLWTSCNQFAVSRGHCKNKAVSESAIICEFLQNFVDFFVIVAAWNATETCRDFVLLWWKLLESIKLQE